MPSIELTAPQQSHPPDQAKSPDRLRYPVDGYDNLTTMVKIFIAKIAPLPFPPLIIKLLFNDRQDKLSCHYANRNDTANYIEINGERKIFFQTITGETRKQGTTGNKAWEYFSRKIVLLIFFDRKQQYPNPACQLPECRPFPS